MFYFYFLFYFISQRIFVLHNIFYWHNKTNKEHLIDVPILFCVYLHFWHGINIYCKQILHYDLKCLKEAKLNKIYLKHWFIEPVFFYRILYVSKNDNTDISNIYLILFFSQQWYDTFAFLHTVFAFLTGIGYNIYRPKKSIYTHQYQ